MLDALRVRVLPHYLDTPASGYCIPCRPPILAACENVDIAFASSLRRGLLLLAVAVSRLIVICNVIILASGRSTTANIELVPRAEAGLLLGAGVEPGGGPSPMLADRIRAAAELWRAGRVRRILVTGDEALRGQVSVMARALGRLDVPKHALVLDRFGIDTWDSILRARDVFRVHSVIAVTQGFHLPRTLWLTDRAGLQATGLEADLTDYGSDGWYSRGREIVAHVKALGDVVLGADARLADSRLMQHGSARRGSGGRPLPRGHTLSAPLHASVTTAGS